MCVLFYMCGKCYFASVVVQRLRWSNMKGPCIIMHYVIFLMWMVKHERTMHNYALCHLPNVDGQFLVIYLFFL
jgi:hypothetical protein